MELIRIDTQRAYERIWEKITTLDLPPGSPINDQQLAAGIDMALTPVQEALKLLVHDDLVYFSARHGLYVTEVDPPALEQLSEMRLALEGLAARRAAQRATTDDLVVLESLRGQQAALESPDPHVLFNLDHHFHQAVARAAHNTYLASTLERFFGLSRRLWYMILPELGFLSAAVEEHLALLEAIKTGDAARAEQLMCAHVQDFYDKVKTILPAGE